MTVLSRLLALALPVAAMIAAPVSARADDDGPPMPAQGAPMPVYPAPLSQQTQTTYVPQSVALSGPEEITNTDDNRPVPLGYTVVQRARRHLIVGGAVTFGVTYGVSVLAAAAGDDAARNGGTNELASLWIPVAGPFMQAAQTTSSMGKVFLVGLGGAQLAGAIMLYYGLTSTQRVFVRNDLVGRMTITPMVGNGSSGMALSGQF